MARIDLNQSNGWIAEEHDSAVVTESNRLSAVESNARRVRMTTDLKSVPRFVGEEPDVIAEAAAYDEADVTLDDVTLTARKFGKIYRYSEEDVQDTFVDLLNESKADFARHWAVKFDNAALGVTAAANGGTVPFTSVYREVSQYNSASNRIQTAGPIELDDLSNGLGLVETGDYWDESDAIVIAHPSLKGSLRVMEDANGNLVQQYTDPLAPTRETLFGYRIVWSWGARTHATATSKPTGNPLVIFGNRRLLLNGVRSGPESMLSREAEFRTDEVLLKCRARRGFAVAKPSAFSIVEVTAAP
jgi:HK97 family phage major capsid protein